MPSVDWRLAGIIAACLVAWLLPSLIIAAALLVRARRRMAEDLGKELAEGVAEDVAYSYKRGFADGYQASRVEQGREWPLVSVPNQEAAIRLPRDPEKAYDVLLSVAHELVDMADALKAAGGNGGDT